MPHADAAADPSRTVSGRRDDARRRSLRLENRDSPLELCLLLEQVEEGRIVRVAVFPNLTELLGHLLAAERTQRLELRTQLAIAVSGNDMSSTIGAGNALIELLSRSGNAFAKSGKASLPSKSRLGYRAKAPSRFSTYSEAGAK